MQAIHAFLVPDQRGGDIANLHTVLDRLGLGDAVTQQERAEQRYGEGTVEAVRRMQQQFGVGTRQAGVVDEETAEVINRQLFEMGVFRLVEGRVVKSDDSPVVGNLLFAFDKENIGGAYLGSANTNADGAYRVFYDPSLYARQGEGVLRVKETIDLIVQVYDADGATIAESQPLHDPGRRVEVNLRLGELQPPVVRKQFIVRGQVFGANGPLNGVQVNVFDRDLFFRRDEPNASQHLGTEISKQHPTGNGDGWFEIAYTSDTFAAGDVESNGKLIPDLIFSISRDGQQFDKFQVYRLPDGEALKSELLVSDDDLIMGLQAREVEEVRIVITPGDARPGPSEYERLWRAIASLIPERVPADADDALREALACEAAERFDEQEHRDVSFVARETNLERDMVALFASACRLSREFRLDVPPAVFYGLARVEGIGDLRRLASANLATLDAVLRRAVAENIIPPMEEAEHTLALETIRRFAPRLLLDQMPDGNQPALGAVLSLAVETPEHQVELLQLSADFEGPAANFWESLREHEVFANEVGRIRYVTQLGALTQNNVPLMQAIRDSIPAAASMRTLAFHLDEEAIANLVNDPGVTIPEEVPGETEGERRQYYTEAVMGLLRNGHPTATAARVVAKLAGGDEEGPRHLSLRTAKFIETAALEHEDFDLGASRVADFKELIEGDEAEKRQALDEAQRIQRLFRISTSDQNFSGLVQTNFSSSYDIAQNMTEQGFVRSQQESLGGEAQAQLTYRRAVAVTAANLTMAVHAHQLAADGKPYAVTGGLKETPSWAQMFGAAEMCECQHCRSWLSPAAYFVDLLLFLRKKHSTVQVKTPLDVLLSRRPDLEHLKLSCENTNTTLPYIDIVNEVLESFIVLGGKLDESTAHNVTDETSGELRALPQHVQAKAYEKLAEADYPLTLPFDRWLEMSRAYLGQLGVSRHDLIAGFEGAYADAAAETAKGRERVSELLGLSAREYEIITGENFGGQPVVIELLKLYGLDDAQIYRPLKKADSGASVVVLQAKLVTNGSELVLDGNFDDAVELAVKAFQLEKGLPDSGEVDEATWTLLKPLEPEATAAFTTFVPEFLERTGLTFVELTELLKCRFINPAQALYDELEAIYAAFGINSKDLRAFVNADFVADEALTKKLARTGGQTPEQLSEALNEKFPIEQLTRLMVLYSESGDNCDFAGLLIQHLNGAPLDDEELRRMHVFIRLWRKLDWTMTELDKALSAFKEGDSITPGCLEKVAQLGHLRRATEAKVVTLLGLWHDLDTHGPHALYLQLFQNRVVLNPLDTDFALTPGTGELAQARNKTLVEKSQSIIAALRIREDELTLIREDAVRDGKLDSDEAQQSLSLANLSLVYRYAVLARLLNLRVGELIALKQLAGGQPFTSPRATIEFAQLVEQVQRSGFTIAQLRYLYSEELPGPAKTAPPAQELTMLAESLRAGLIKIAQEQKLPEEEITPEMLQAGLSLLLDAERAALATSLIEGRKLLDGPPAADKLKEQRTRLSEERASSGALAGAAAAAIFPEWLGLDVDEKDVNAEALRIKLALLLDAGSVALAMALIEGRALPGGPLTDEQLEELIEKQRGQLIAGRPLSRSAADAAANAVFPDRKLLSDADAQERQDRVKTAMQNLLQLLRQDRAGVAMSGMLPLLRDMLSRTFIKQTLSGALQLDAQTAQALLEDDVLLKSIDKGAQAITDFLPLNGLRAEYFNNRNLEGDPPVLARVDPNISFDWKLEKPAPEVNAESFSVRWSGWIVAPHTEDYKFHVRANDGVRLWIDEEMLVDKWLDGDGSVEHTATTRLEAGAFYPIKIEFFDNTLEARVEMQWSSKSTAKAVVPSEQLFTSFPDAFTRLHKIALLARTLKLTTSELRHFTRQRDEFDDFNLGDFSKTPFPEGFLQWRRLSAYVALRDRRTPGNMRLLDVIAAPEEERVAALVSATHWDASVVKDALEACGKQAADLDDERNILSLERVIELSRALGVLPGVLKKWANDAPSKEQAEAIVNAVKAKYEDSAWLEVARAINDPLRERQRDALVAYVLRMEQIPADVRTPNGLFEHFLIDVEMSACMLTSRIKQAISSVQLFAQRCLLNLEKENEISPDAIDAEQWKWRKNYRVWEANRKIFLFPEDFAEPELLDLKSPFFKELESELLQGDVNAETVERALLTYLEKLDSVARLEICGFYWERDTSIAPNIDVLHVVGRTMTGVPRVYYYRRLVDGREWTPWEPISLDIQGVEKDDENSESGVHLLPVVWRGKLYLFWPQFFKKSRKSELVGGEVEPSKKIPLKEPGADWEIKLAWSRYEQGRWSSKRLSDLFPKWPTEWPVVSKDKGLTTADINIQGALRSPDEKPTPDRLMYLRLHSQIVNGALVIRLHEVNRSIAGFVFTDPHSSPQLQGPGPSAEIEIVAGRPRYMNYRFGGGLWLRSPEEKSAGTKILGANQGDYYVNTPGYNPLLPLDAPIFYQNAYHSYFVQLSVTKEDEFLQRTDPPSVSTPFLGSSKMLDAGISVFESAAPRPPEPVFNASPWLSATVQLLPARIESAAAEVKLNSPAVLGTPQEKSFLVKAIDAESRAVLVHDSIFVKKTRPVANVRFHTFFHPHVSTFIHELKRRGVPGLLNISNQMAGAKDEPFKPSYQPVEKRFFGPEPKYPKHDVDFSYGGAYSVYNWELFFQVPLLLATRLSQNQRFPEAQKWLHYIFDPTDSSFDKGPQRFWKVRPLRELKSESLDRMFRKLKPGETNSPEEQEVVNQLDALVKNPFQPHRIARMRPLAYQKLVVMKYLDNLIAWGDQLFRRDTMESINEATQYYVLAAKLLGKRPQRVPRSGRIEAKSFAELKPLLDEAGNALVEIENELPFAGLVEPADGQAGMSALLSMGSGLYFCLPQNDKLLGYWDLVEDRLFKIRHCMNIEGMVRQLPLFEPPIDPALLVKAAAAGLDIGSVLSDMGAPMPRYRFNVMLQKALEMCGELKSLGGMLLGALEKLDAEVLTLIRAKHETALLKDVRMLKEWQKAEAEASLDALRASRNSAIHRLAHYSRLLGEAMPGIPPEPVVPAKPGQPVQVGNVPRYETGGKFRLVGSGSITVGAAIGDIDVADIDSGTKILTYENDELLQSFLAAAYSMSSSAADALSAALHLIPQFHIAGKPLGIGGEVGFGGIQLGSAATIAARVLGSVSSWHGFKSTLAGKLAGFIWREQEHALQRNNAALEIEQLDKQIIAAQIRIHFAQKELENQDLNITRTEEVEQFLQGKYTGPELYGWMIREVSNLFFQSYQMTYDLAKMTERCYRFQLGLSDSNFIQFGYWDSLKKGLLSGERLHLSLKQLERAYLEQDRREYEITKHVSLLQIDPLALVKLRQTGVCEFDLPEVFFDLDFPGHYFRRIKSVSVSVPCVVGPYTNVSGTLTLLSNRVRIKPRITEDGYAEKTDGDDPRFIRDYVPTQSIATSAAQNDSGMFEFNFRDERYLPFEGGGVISRWRFELPREFRQFDYDTCSDLVLHLKYTAREGGEPLKQRAVKELNEAINEIQLRSDAQQGLARLFSLRYEFPSEWHRLLGSAEANGDHVQAFTISKERFPFLFQGRKLTISRVDMFAVPKGESPELQKILLTVPGPAPIEFKEGEKIGKLVHRAGKGDVEVKNEPDKAKWTLTVAKNDIAATLGRLEDILLMCHYSIGQT